MEKMINQDGSGWDLDWRNRVLASCSRFLPFSHEVVKQVCITGKTFFPGVWESKMPLPGYRALFVFRKE